MNKNTGLNDARAAKKDEFYTQLSDIENELKHYAERFRGKVVYSNCDNWRKSQFVKYFKGHFHELGLKRYVATCYGRKDLFAHSEALWYEYDGVEECHGELKGDGDFRSFECVERLKQADIVVTNPPFSLFREFVGLLKKLMKDFLIIGNVNAVTYKDVFEMIKDNEIWLGYGFKGGATHFASDYEDTATAGDHREGMIRVSGVEWFTNMDTTKRHEPLTLCRKYAPENYPRCDDYDAINVDKTSDIPMDYDGVMGVPITFLDKFCPEQFEIVGRSSPTVNGKMLYQRIFIRKRHNIV